MNIFLTGGAGYIGSAAVRKLLETGHTVTVYDSLVTGYRAAVPVKATFIQGDLANRNDLAAALTTAKFDAVMHFAAFIEAGESMTNPPKYYHNNLANSVNLIDAAVKAGVNRFVLSSTAAVYQSSDQPLSEESPLGPVNVYGHTKLMIEEVLDFYREIFGLHYAALRYFNAAGALPDQGEAHQPESHLIPLVLQVPLGQREDIKIYGTDYPTPDGTCIRDYIHISDLISAHLLALDALENEEKLAYNLGNGKGYSVREVIETARQITGHPIPAEEIPRRPGDSPRLVASSEKIKQELGWQPEIPELGDIINSAWEWHQSHPNGYEN
ncbi:MAG TPA: UDP-glucose 4-epimerase GalE [Chloroflexi bacterium]|nr:MAG: UDP-glucose 4-epimerase GalE [Chloroflexota bacterium]HDD55421.1 UDP-glucose 4-epimerase GalE [Chloroflexota bacterium]